MHLLSLAFACAMGTYDAVCRYVFIHAILYVSAFLLRAALIDAVRHTLFISKRLDAGDENDGVDDDDDGVDYANTDNPRILLLSKVQLVLIKMTVLIT